MYTACLSVATGYFIFHRHQHHFSQVQCVYVDKYAVRFTVQCTLKLTFIEMRSLNTDGHYMTGSTLQL